MMEQAWMQMQEDEATNDLGCLFDGPSHQRPCCTGAYPAIDGMGKTFDFLHHSSADDGYNTSVSEADADADDVHSVLVSWHGAPLDMPDDHRSPPVTPPTIASGGEFPSSFLHAPPSQRKFKRHRAGSPGVPLEYGSQGQTSDGGGHLGESPRKKIDSPSNYGHANLARKDAMPTNATSLLVYTNFPDVCADVFATLTPQM